MKLEIDIAKDYYKIICKRVKESKPYHAPYEHEVIANGKPLIKGQWIDTNDKGFEFHRLYKCSNCEHTVCEYPEEIKRYKFCYNCGAIMESVDKYE